MGGVLTGFAIIGAIIAAGYVVGRVRLLGPHAQFVMSRLAFFVLMPCLLFHTIATAHIESLVSPMLWVSLVSAVTVGLVAVVLFRLVLRRSVATTTVGALASGYVNANNIGLPVAVYVLGQATVVVPVILLQLVVLAPLALTVLDAATSSGAGGGHGSPDPSGTRSSSPRSPGSCAPRCGSRSRSRCSSRSRSSAPRRCRSCCCPSA